MSFEFDPHAVQMYIDFAAQQCNIPVKNTIYNANGLISNIENLRIMRFYDQDNPSPDLQITKVAWVAKDSRGVDYYFWEEKSNLDDQQDRIVFGYGSGLAATKICTFVDRNKKGTSCSYALFDSSYLNADVVGTMVCTDADTEKPLVMRTDTDTQEDVLTLTGEVCKLIEQLSGSGNRQSKEIADKLSELLEIPKVDPSLSLDIKDKSRFPDVEEALAKLALNSSGIEKEERIDIKGTVIITNICVDPARKAIISTAQVGALGDNQDTLELSRIVGDPNDSTRINYLVGEHHSLIGSPDAENVRKNLHRIAGLLGLKYFLNPERDAVIPGPIEDYRAFVDILNDAARAQIGTDTFQTDRHNLPITKLDSADEELRRKYPFINPGNNLAVDQVLLPNDYSRYFNHSEYARLMTVLRNRISAEDVVLGNNVLLMAGDGELRAYYRRWLKPLGGISDQDNKIINKVLINCNSDDGTQNCVIFGTGHRASTGKYAQSTIINPKIDKDCVREYYYHDVTMYFSLGNSKLLLTTISADDGYNRTRRVKSVIVDLDNYKKRDLPWRYRAEVDLPAVLARFKEAKAKTEAAGVDFKKACEVSLATVLPNLVPEIAAKIPELMDAPGAIQPLRKRGWFQRH